MAARGAWWLVACLWLLPGLSALGGEPAESVQAWQRVDPALLEDQRGGLVMPSGLQVSFGFERTVHVNGALVLALRVDVADVGRISADEASQLATLGRTQLVQIGSGNAAQAQAGGLVIQNSLDGQRIQVQSTLDASSNALGMLQALNVAQMLQAASTGSLGGL
ncbi:hypothetical protein ACW5EG_05330 [Luteimonas sp. A611]